MSAPQSAPAPRTSPAPVTWRVWPLSEGSADAWMVLGSLVVAGGMVGWQMASVAWGVGAAGLAAAAAWRFFVPTIYELSALGVTHIVAGRRRRVPWNLVDRFEVGRRGVYLSSAGAPLEAFRGIYVPWGHKRDEVLANITYYLAHRGSGSASSIRRAPPAKA